jgi:hypothetical protein
MIPSTVFWHYTSRQAAEEIIRNGFRDGTGPYLTSDIYSGVWLSDVPLDPNDGPRPGGRDCVYLRVTLPYTLEDLADYEWVGDLVPDPDTGELCNPSRYREWLCRPTRSTACVSLICWKRMTWNDHQARRDQARLGHSHRGDA